LVSGVWGVFCHCKKRGTLNVFHYFRIGLSGLGQGEKGGNKNVSPLQFWGPWEQSYKQQNFCQSASGPQLFEWMKKTDPQWGGGASFGARQPFNPAWTVLGRRGQEKKTKKGLGGFHAKTKNGGPQGTFFLEKKNKQKFAWLLIQTILRPRGGGRPIWGGTALDGGGSFVCGPGFLGRPGAGLAKKRGRFWAGGA